MNCESQAWPFMGPRPSSLQVSEILCCRLRIISANCRCVVLCACECHAGCCWRNWLKVCPPVGGFPSFLRNRWRADGRLVCGQPETLLVYEYSAWHSSYCVKSWLRAAFRQFTFWHDSLKTSIMGCHYLSSFKLPLNIYLSVLLNITSHFTLYNYEQVLLFYLHLLFFFFSFATQK